LSALFLLAMAVPLPAMAQRPREAGITRTTPAPPPARSTETIARDLSDKAQDIWNLASNQRAKIPVELYVALAGFASSAKAYSQMAAEERDENGLRGSGRRLIAAAREIDALLSSAGPQSLQGPWRLAQEHVARLSNKFDLGYAFRGSSQDTMVQASRPSQVAPKTIGGTFRWRGRVDGSDYIMLQGNQVTIRHIEFQSIRDASHELSSPLPQQPVQAQLKKLRGRGTVEIVRQPNAANNYTLTLLIEDQPSGDDSYEFEVIW
jgi:hypothetical protein